MCKCLNHAKNSAPAIGSSRGARTELLMSCLNASAETVSLAVLDACERAARGIATDYTDASNSDAAFMKACVHAHASRLRMLKAQAAAGWRPEFTSMLERCHSIAVDDVDEDEKEGVRVEKEKCMACGRWERRCKKALNCVGPLDFERFNRGDVSELQPAWQKFEQDYDRASNSDRRHRREQLPSCDFGEFTLGQTCLRKTELFFMCNTLLLENCFEANIAFVLNERARSGPDDFVWYHATPENASLLVERMRNLELAIADDKRPVPSWGVDTELWATLNGEREYAGDNNPKKITALLRERAETTLETARAQLYAVRGSRSSTAAEEDDDGNDYDVVGDSDEDENEEECPDHVAGKRAHRKRVLDSSDEEDGVEDPIPRVCTTAGTKRAAEPRRSKRFQGDNATCEAGPSSSNAPAPAPAPSTAVVVEEAFEALEEEEEEETRDMRRRSRAAPANAFTLAQAQRVPGQRLPARRDALYNLGTLQLKLMREGRDADSATCTSAMFVLQELLARVEQLAHTAGI